MYNFKFTPELLWAVVVTVVGVLATTVATQGALPPDDWRTWGIAVAAGVARALVALVLSRVPSNAA